MSLDAFTVNAIIVVLVLAVLLMGVIWRSGRDAADRLAALERQVVAPPPPNPAKRKINREFCGAIHRIYPHAQVGVDFDVQDDGRGPVITEWLLPNPQPTADEIKAARSAYVMEQLSQGYREARLPEYPSIGDQLDALYKARQGDPSELADIDARIREVKARHPKPGTC